MVGKALRLRQVKIQILDSAHPALVERKSLASVKHDSRLHRRDYRTASLIAALITLSLLLGWMMGRAGWDRAVSEANSEISTSAEHVGDFSAESTQISVESNSKQQHIQDPIVMNVSIRN